MVVAEVTTTHKAHWKIKVLSQGRKLGGHQQITHSVWPLEIRAQLPRQSNLRHLGLPSPVFQQRVSVELPLCWQCRSSTHPVSNTLLSQGHDSQQNNSEKGVQDVIIIQNYFQMLERERIQTNKTEKCHWGTFDTFIFYSESTNNSDSSV